MRLEGEGWTTNATGQPGVDDECDDGKYYDNENDGDGGDEAPNYCSGRRRRRLIHYKDDDGWAARTPDELTPPAAAEDDNFALVQHRLQHPSCVAPPKHPNYLNTSLAVSQTPNSNN